MIQFLYNIPSAAMATIVAGSTLAIVMGGYAIATRFKLVLLDPEQRAMMISMVSIITTINSLIVAFAAISVWDAYNDADRTVAAEATCAGELARDLSAFNSPAADVAGRALRAYMEHVIHKEWPVMQQESRQDPETENLFEAMFDAANYIAPTDTRQTVLLGEILARTNEMVKHRQQRILTLDISMPATLWAVMLVVSALSFLLLYALPPTAFHKLLIGSWGLTLGLTFFFVLAVDRPFAGEVSVSPEPFQKTINGLVANRTWPAQSVAP
ncbi:bestrophin-like domain [Chitinimonas naiadis]